MKRDELKIKKKLLEKMPYEKEQLRNFDIRELKMLASVLGINSWQKNKDQLVKLIFDSKIIDIQ